MGFRRRWPGVSYGRGEDWHYVGEAGEPAFENSWANYSGLTSAAFRIREAGIVDIHFVIAGGSANGIFTLPEGYRPSAATFVGTGIGFTSSPVARSPFGIVVDTDGSVEFGTYPTSDVYFFAGQMFLDPPDVAP